MSNAGEKGVDADRFPANAVPTHIPDLHAYLGGPWRFERTVFDTLRDAEGSCLGEARFMPENAGLRYRESGEMVFDEFTTVSEREYVYDFLAPGVAEVRFTDGQFFHILDLTKGIVRVEHQCKDDTYLGLYRAISDMAWLSVWRVTGPRKSQVITTHYLRALRDRSG